MHTRTKARTDAGEGMERPSICRERLFAESARLHPNLNELYGKGQQSANYFGITHDNDLNEINRVPNRAGYAAREASGGYFAKYGGPVAFWVCTKHKIG